VRRATTVLIVEDDPAIRNMLVEALKLEGYRCTGAPDSAAALVDIRRARPDLIITDYHLPGGDGLELLRMLQSEGFSDIPALVISADARPPDWPITSFIPKPFDLEAILRAVRRALGKGPAESDQRTETGQPPLLGLACWLGSPGLALA
jgi:two-component system nitrogen regulation response regulator GlnG